jgi:hypothetical protein
MIDTAVILKRFEEPDEVRTFDNGRFKIVHIGGMTIGRATYEPGVGAADQIDGDRVGALQHPGERPRARIY